MEIELEAARGVRAVAAAHALPCRIAHDGAAPVAAYFRPEPAAGALEAAFRGQTLRGRRLPLPAGYAAVVFREHRAVFSDLQDRVWSPLATFGEFTCWNRGAAPSRSACRPHGGVLAGALTRGGRGARGR